MSPVLKGGSSLRSRGTRLKQSPTTSSAANYPKFTAEETGGDYFTLFVMTNFELADCNDGH